MKEEIAKQLLIDGASIKAKKIINFLAERGDISISNSIIHSNISILYSSGVNNKFSLKDNVSSSTDKSRIEIGKDALAEGSGGAFIHQDENGNITVGFK